MSHILRCTGFDPKKIYMLGEASSGLEPRGALQNYEQLKNVHLQKGILFEDPQFVPNEIQLGDGVNLNEVEWLRPKEIRKNPQFISEQEDRFDVNQGILGDCWFMAALADITQNKDILEKVVPSNQSFVTGYAGIFHFRFWQYGRWIDIVVDDRLPTRKTKDLMGRVTRELIYVKSKDPNEFWTALLEKAYAKLYGSYKNLDGGFVSEALGDLTGGLTEIHKAGQEHWNDNLYDMILESYEKKSFMGCAIMNENKLAAAYGLVSAHAYSITEVIELKSKLGNIVIKLLRIRNPWGKVEWRGNWSDGSAQWNAVTDDTKAALFLRVKDDGEFWIEFKDFITYFDILELCHPNPDAGLKHWNCLMLDGSWKADGEKSPKFSKYILTLNEENTASTHTVKIGLMQKNQRVHHKQQLPIGFKIMTIEGHPVYCKPPEEYIQVTGHMKLSNGKYLLVPFVEGLDRNDCEYLLRIYSTANFYLE